MVDALRHMGNLLGEGAIVLLLTSRLVHLNAGKVLHRQHLNHEHNL